MSYDIRCFGLASLFLSDVSEYTDARCEELAQRIQQTIEEYIAELTYGGSAHV